MKNTFILPVEKIPDDKTIIRGHTIVKIFTQKKKGRLSNICYENEVHLHYTQQDTEGYELLKEMSILVQQADTGFLIYDFSSLPKEARKQLENYCQSAPRMGNSGLLQAFTLKEWAEWHSRIFSANADKAKKLADRFRRIPLRSGLSREQNDQISKAVCGDRPVLITGPTGSGKTELASYIHETIQRKGSFRHINAAELPQTLFESALFGHTKGAFTGADKETPGLIKSAEGGTLFLDEITEMPFYLQSKLLRTMDNAPNLKYSPVGTTEELAANVKVICATNIPLQQALSQNTLRHDLLYRFPVIIELPPLCDRIRNCPDLLRQILEDAYQDFLQELCPSTSFCSIFANGIYNRVLERLGQYDWPGNIRQLRSVADSFLEHYLYLRKGAGLSLEDVENELRMQSLRTHRHTSDHQDVSVDILNEATWNERIGLITQHELAQAHETIEAMKHRLYIHAQDICRRPGTAAKQLNCGGQQTFERRYEKAQEYFSRREPSGK